MMFNEKLFIESAWATGIAAIGFSLAMIALIILIERIIK